MYRSDLDLVQNCLDGDALSWKELIARYARLVYSIPQHCGLGPPDAETVFQKVFTQLHRHLDQLQDGQRLAPWLIQTTWRETQIHGKRARPSPKPNPFGTNGHLPPEQAKAWERQHLLLQALDQLDERCYQLLASWFIESKKCSPAELAAQLGIDVREIESARVRCFKKFDAMLIEMDIDLDD